MQETAAIVELNQLHEAKNLEALAKHPMLYLKPEWAIEIAESDNWVAKWTLVIPLTEIPQGCS